MEPNFVGNHGSGYGFQQFKYMFDGIADRTPIYLTDEESKTLYGFVAGDENVKDPKTAETLASYGYLRKNGGDYVPDILVLNRTEIKKAYERLDKTTVSELSAASEKVITQLKSLRDKIAETIKADLPAIFAENEYQWQMAVADSYHARGYIVSEALRSGWLKPAEKVSPSIGAHIFIE